MNSYQLKLGNSNIEVELNKFAKQADGSVMIKNNDTCVLVTAVGSKRESSYDFFPLTINYEEKLYAVGKVPGNYARREARPSDQATLAARLIDRPIRPLFPEKYKNEVQIACSILSLDQNYEPDILSINGASLSLMLATNIPFLGPVGAVCIGLIDGKFIINPNQEEKEKSILDLKLAGTLNEINMVEAGCEELSEEIIVDAIMFGHEQIKKLVEFQQKIIDDLNIKKLPFEYIELESEKNLKEIIFNEYAEKVTNSLKEIEKLKRQELVEEIKNEILEKHLDESLEDAEKVINNIFHELEKKQFRRMVIDEKLRVDGRKTNELRKLESEVSLLPRVHGSALFTRGETQALAVVTLGVKSDEQTFDGLEAFSSKNFLLHYNFPPFSVGECGRMGAPGRREIGHGHLAERAIKSMMPSTDEFGYTTRVVSEILESNGSSSQATICATSMALMQAGVPLKKAVAGIAMGLIADEKGYTILTDIQGLEDHLGDMDFKVAGTKDGICAIQMDIKIDGISREILIDSLNQAKKGRLELLNHMNQTIDKPNENVSEYAPKMLILKIEVSQIKDVIGKGGDTINKIIEETQVKIDIEEDGTVLIYGVDQKMIDRAKEIILKITKIYKIGDIFKGKVTRIETYGAFVTFEDQEGLLHISDLSDKRVEKVEDVIKLNDIVNIEIKEIDFKKRIKVKLIVKKED